MAAENVTSRSKPGSFSVVTPNYNMGQYLAATIESVLRNLRPGDQYFVIDGGSTDGSVEIIRSYEKHLAGWVSEPDAGYADAIAKGFSRASGTYLCWINCGDLLLDGALDQARERLASSGADMIFGDDFYVDEADRIILRSYGGVPSLRKMMLFGGWTPLQDACFWKRSLYDAAGGFNVELKYAADYDLFLRMSMQGRCEYVPLVFSAFRKHEGQKSVHGRASYKQERIYCREQALKKSGHTWLSGKLSVLYYETLARLRARVLIKFRDSRKLAGKDVHQFSCRSYD